MTQPPYGQSPYEPQQSYGPPPPQQPQYGQPQYDQQQYSQPYGQPQYSQPYGQPQYVQPVQPQYGPGGFGGLPPQKKSPIPWIITAAIAVVAVIGVTLALVLTGSKGSGGGGGGGFASDPVAVTTSFMEAARKGDASEALKYACGKLYEQIKKSGDNPKGTTGMTYTVSQDANINGDKATVDVELKYNMKAGSGSDYNSPGTTTVTANLEKQSGSWMVCSVK